MRKGSPKYVGHGGKWDTTGVLLDEGVAGGGAERGECANDSVLDLRTIFANTRPVELEIGSGKGTFLLARGAARPEVNLLGLEYARSYCLYTADRVRRAGLKNVRMVRAEAGQFVKTRLADESLWRVHIYFPDPWPKRRHHRRRLIQPGFIDEVRRTLRLGGQLLIVTDHWDYFRHIDLVLGAANGLARVRFPRMTDTSGRIVATNFERKYVTQGRAVHRVALMRYA